MNEDLHPILKSMIPLVQSIADTFGRNCEVVLHDSRNPQSSIIEIANGHVTGRKIGGPLSEFGLIGLRKGKFQQNNVNYMKKTPDGRILKSTSMFINDENGDLIGFLCINLDISELTIIKNLLNDFTNLTELYDDVEHDSDSYGNTINEVLNNVVNKTLDTLGKPVAFMSKDEKVNIVEMLDKKGVFLIKGAVDYVAKVLCVSRYTIYNYLDEIRITD